MRSFCPLRFSVFFDIALVNMATSVDPSTLTPEYLATDEGPRVLRTLSALTAISTVFFGLRIAVRLHRKNFGIGVDDWLLFAAVVSEPTLLLLLYLVESFQSMDPANMLCLASASTGPCMDLLSITSFYMVASGGTWSP